MEVEGDVGTCVAELLIFGDEVEESPVNLERLGAEWVLLVAFAGKLTDFCPTLGPDSVLVDAA